MKKVLVTGARGFIGRHALNTLIERGVFDVHAITSNDIPRNKIADCLWHVANLLESTQINALFHAVQPTHLMHFAWYTVRGKYWKARENFLWVQSSLEILRKFYECGGKRVVMAGTCAEYDWNYGYCSEFITPRATTTSYGTCKQALQVMLDAYSVETGLSSAWGRIFFLYGPYEHSTRLVSSVISSLLQNKPVGCSQGNQIRDFLYVQDVADAFVALLESDVHGPVNIASGRPVALKEIIYRIAEKLNRRDLVQLGALPAPANDPHLLVADVTRLANEVRWSPKYDLDTGLQKTINWWKEKLSGINNCKNEV